MFNKKTLEDGLALAVKGIVKCQTHLAGLDYTGVKLQYPRIVVNVKSPQYLERPSECTTYMAISDTKGIQKVRKQFTIDVEIQGIDSPDSDNVYEVMQRLVGKLGADYDLLFKDFGIDDFVLQSTSRIEDISITLGTKIESRYRTVLTLHGFDTVYDEEISKIVEVNPQIKLI